MPYDLSLPRRMLWSMDFIFNWIGWILYLTDELQELIEISQMVAF